MKLEDFDYALPGELIAQEPLQQRDTSRLMVLDRKRETLEHACFQQLPAFLKSGDLLVANDTRVIPARLYGKKESGGWAELFLLNFIAGRAEGTQVWECLLKSRRKIRAGAKLSFSPSLSAEVLERSGNETWQVQLSFTGDFDTVLRETGITPLPPYIKRARTSSCSSPDRERYQTVYAQKNGAVAAPTAGLHFTPSLMDEISRKGAELSFVTLHVGYGTFQPIHHEDLEAHAMHKEFFEVTSDTAEKVNRAASERRRVIAVGTTSARVLETASHEDGTLRQSRGYTDLYMYPGYSFKAVDALITNFHLPKSSLLLLVSAFAGTEFIKRAYREAIEQKYRFFSYGDAMLIL